MPRGQPEAARRPSLCSLQSHPPAPSRLDHKSNAPAVAGREPALIPRDPCDGEPSRYALGPQTSLKHGQMIAVLFPGSQKGQRSKWWPCALAGMEGTGSSCFCSPGRASPVVAGSWPPPLGKCRSCRGTGRRGWLGKAANPVVFIPGMAAVFLTNQIFYFCYCNCN